MKRVVALLFCVAFVANAQSMGGGTFGANMTDGAVNGGAFGAPSGTASISPCDDIPSSLTIVFDGKSIDGANNSTLTNGDTLSTWVNVGANGTANNATQTLTSRPLYLANAIGTYGAVDFDGTNDSMVVSASTTAMRSFSASGNGEVWAVLRHDASPAAYDVFFGNSTGTGTKGWVAYVNPGGSTNAVVYRGSPSGAHAVNAPGTMTFAAWRSFSMRGDGTRILTKFDGLSAVSTTYTNTPFVDADLASSFNIGAHSSGASTSMNGAIAFFAFSPTELSSTDRAKIEALISCRYSITH